MYTFVSWVVGKGRLLWPVCSLNKMVSFCPALFCIPRPILPIILGISWLPTFTLESPVMKRTSFLVLVLESVVGLQEPVHFSFSGTNGWGKDLDCWHVEWLALETDRDHSIIFEIAPRYCNLDSFVDCGGYYSISSKGFLPTVVNIMVIWIKSTHSCPF